jgi:hypothetical protein
MNTFANSFFRMNGLIHDVKTLVDSKEKSAVAVALIQREASLLCISDTVGKESFKAIMNDYGFDIRYAGSSGYILHGDVYIAFPLL